MLSKTLAVVVVSSVLAVHAQTTTTTAAASTPTLDTCIISCLTQALSNSTCTSYTELTCVCTSSSFQQTAEACLSSNCTATDLQTAAQLQAQQCAALSTASGSGTSTAGSTAASSASSASAASTSKSAAMALSAPFSYANLVGTLVASAGVLVGAAFVL